MTFRPVSISGMYLVDPDRQWDQRGYFARTWCRREFHAKGLSGTWVQGSVSHTHAAGTIRGMHWQASPHEEAKLIRCIRGAIHDVVIDLRPESPTFLRHTAVTLTAEGGALIFIPPGCAHGFQTLVDECEVEYHMSTYYHPVACRGVRWDDPAFKIQWPLPVTVVSERDRSYPDFRHEMVLSTS